MHGLCGVWFFHALDHTFQLSQSRAFISRINLAAVSELKIIPDPLYDGKASIIARPLPAGYEKNSHFIEECTLPYGSVEVWNGSAWIPKEAITDGGNAIDNLIRAKAYIHPLEQIHGSRTDVIKFLYPQQKIR